MADIALGREVSLPRLRLWAVEWLVAHRELVALGGLMLVAGLLRFWDLDAKALHHDESLHAFYTWNLAEAKGYVHDPLMHGPFLFHSGAAVFFLFGDSDYTTRILPALFGTALAGMPYLLRKQLGIKAVLIAAVLLTVSPTLLYVSRFYRDDIYICVWVLAMVICVWRYLDEQRPGYLYALAAVMALSYATMEITFIHIAILLLFVDGLLAIDLGRRREGEAVSDEAVMVRTLALAPVAWLVAAAWPLLGKARGRFFGREALPPSGDLIVVLGTLALPQFAAGIQQLPFVGDRGYRTADEAQLRVMTVSTLLCASAYVGLLWRPRVWLIAAAAFYVPYILLFTTFFTNQPLPWQDAFWQGRGGFFSGIWDSLDYWLDQHHVKRGDQPSYYYGLMTPLYEFLPLLLALGGAAWLALEGDSLRRWLLFWLAGIFIGLSVAGEKMPWLEVHIALPLALVGAVALAGAVEALRFERGHWRTAAIAGALSSVAVLLLVEAETSGVRLAGWLLGGALLGWTIASLLRGRLAFGRAALAVAVAALLTLTVRASLTASFVNDDTPVDMLVYVQSTPDIPKLRDRIDAVAKASGQGRNLPIVVDGTDGYAWPWAWYLRDYFNVQYITGLTPDYQPPPGAVVLIHRSNSGNFNAPGYSATPYKHRWWFCESYRVPEGSCTTVGALTAGEVIGKLTDGDSLARLGRFFLYRRSVESGVASVDAVAFFPDSLADFDPGRQPAGPPVEPRALADGRIVIGRPGSGPGELQQPADVFIDGAGNIWVADSLNNRVQKFDSEGRWLASVGAASRPAVSLYEPWAVAVDGDGFVYIADTWHNRIVKLSPELTQVAAWGEPALRPDPGPLELYGPRDIVIDFDGTLIVTDTGNKRLVNYAKDGRPLGVIGREGGAPGEFREPVGLTRDAAGGLYVADTWNGRIQRFDLTAAEPTSFAVGWGSQDVLAKPYIAVLSDGRILAAEPGRGLLLLFDAEGRALGSWRPDPDGSPVGVAALAEGGFVFSDVRRGQVQVVPGSLVGELFK